MMTQLTDLFKIGGAVLVFMVVWLLTIALVFRDIHRRRMSSPAQVLWLAAVVLLPIVGFALYWVARLLSRILLRETPLPEDSRVRVTAARPVTPLPSAQAGAVPQGVGSSAQPVQAARQSYSTLPGLGAMPSPMPAAPPATPTGAISFTLIALQGPYQGGQFEVNQTPALIGRGSSALIQLNADQGVSRQHAEIYQDASGSYRIRDLNSTHGTSVNGLQVADALLSQGDQLTLGLSTFVFQENLGRINARKP